LDNDVSGISGFSALEPPHVFVYILADRPAPLPGSPPPPLTLAMSPAKVYIVGVGITQFLKPRGKVSYTELGLQATVKALIDANLTYDAIEQAYCGWIYGPSTSGQRVLYQLGMTQIPIVNVNNNCSTGSTALWMGRNAIRGGTADCVLCVGWEQMEAGPFQSQHTKQNRN